MNPSDCPACQRLVRAREPGDPWVIARLADSTVLLHKHQRYRGWCTLWLNEHVEHLADLASARQQALWGEVATVAAAMGRALGEDRIRINYECLGNVVPHAHWHLIPRRASDPDPRATVWVRPVEETDCGCDDAKRDRLVAALRREMERQ